MSYTDLQHCRATLRGGSRTFHAASLLLPPRVRAPASILYAFCRVADDAIDLSDDPAAELGRLHRRLDLVYAGRPSPLLPDRALSEVVSRHRIPRALLSALLEGFEWDAAGRQYEGLDDLLDYATRVAGTVGAMMAILMGVRDAAALECACMLGMAMQLTNIARDVGEDARAHRLYLPRRWMGDAGIDPDRWLAAPVFSPGLAAVIQQLLEEADRLYRAASLGIASLPLDCRPAIWIARLLYAEIGAEVARNRFDSVTGRARVSAFGKLRTLVASGWRADEATALPAPAAARFVVAAAVGSAVKRYRPHYLPDIEGRVSWLVDLFIRLEATRSSGG